MTKLLLLFVDHRSIFGCEPSWYRAGKSCYSLSLPTVEWGNARTSCHRLDADLAVLNNGDFWQALAQLFREIKLEDQDLLVGLSGSKLRWLWLDGENVSNTDELWGPYEPSGDGKCGSFLKARWNPKWDGYGWRWNDLPCATYIGYICEQTLGSQFLIIIQFSLDDKYDSLLSLFQSNNIYIENVQNCSDV